MSNAVGEKNCEKLNKMVEWVIFGQNDDFWDPAKDLSFISTGNELD